VREYADIFSGKGGSDLKSDLVSGDMPDALSLLKTMIEEKKESTKKESKRKKWNFATSPHEDFGKSIEDTYSAFLYWARVKQDRSQINVSKALRRLEAYADWMDDTGSDLIEPKLTSNSVKEAVQAWCMNASYSREGELLWWCDMSRVNVEKIKKEFPPEESLRAFVWYSHAIMYDENAQKNGMTFVYNVNKIKMIDSFTMMPAKLSTKLDRLTIGVLPVKMNTMYLFESPTWVTVFMKIIGFFMSKKMRERIVICKGWNKVEEMIGLDVTPENFGKVKGQLRLDVIEKKYF